MLGIIDNFFLVKTQKVCDHFTALTGHTKFRLEMWVVVTEIAFYWTFAVKSANIIIFIMAIFITFGDTVSIFVIKNAEKEFLSSLVCESHATHEHLRYWVMVILVSTYVVGIVIGFSLLDIFFILWLLALISEMYISACTALPPGKSKLKKRLRKVTTNRQQSLPAHVPSDS